jgi:hypothetical protein
MSHNDDSHEIVRPGEGRGQWLAMQSAYAEYRRASEALASSAPSIEERSARSDLEAQQRVAFEQYIDARLSFLEIRFDESDRSGVNPHDTPTRNREDSVFLSRFGSHGVLFLVLALALIGTAALSFMRGRNRVRGLETARDQLRAELSATRADIQRVSAQVANSSAPQAARPEPPVSQMASSPAPAKPSPLAPARRRYRFSLVPSHQFKRVGPIEVSLRSVDARQNRVSLSIQSESARLNLQHVRLNQPVRIDAGERGQHLELVIDRISGDGVSGHLND